MSKLARILEKNFLENSYFISCLKEAYLMKSIKKYIKPFIGISIILFLLYCAELQSKLNDEDKKEQQAEQLKHQNEQKEALAKWNALTSKQQRLLPGPAITNVEETFYTFTFSNFHVSK